MAGRAGLNLAPINMGIAPTPLDQNPDSLGAVGLPVWLWVETPSSNSTGPTLTSSASERGYTVTIRAQMTGIDWDLGDGGQVITCGLGNRFDPKTMGPETPVSCGRQHGYQKQGEYTITATSHWKIEWGGIGRTGVITMIDPPQPGYGSVNSKPWLSRTRRSNIHQLALPCFMQRGRAS